MLVSCTSAYLLQFIELLKIWAIYLGNFGILFENLEKIHVFWLKSHVFWLFIASALFLDN